MDWLETLLPLILFAVYFLSQLRKGARKQAREAAPNEPLTSHAAEAEGSRSTTAPTPFEMLIRQIQEAAEEAQREQASAEEQAPPTPIPPPRQTRALRPPAAPVKAREFQGVGGFSHEQHGFGPDNPFSEEAFERLPRGADVTEHAPGHLEHDPHDLFRGPKVARPQRHHPLAARLRKTGSARDAFALREILNAPLSRRRRP